MSFQYGEYNVSEDEMQVWLRIDLDKPATNDRVIQVYASEVSASGKLSEKFGIEFNLAFY